MSLPEDLSLNCRNIIFLSKVLNWRPGAKIKFIREATESAQPDWELDVQQRSYFVLITIVSMYGIIIFVLFSKVTSIARLSASCFRGTTLMFIDS